MTKMELLKVGLGHIASNHGFKADTDELETDGEACIWGGCNVPTIADVEMLCEDLGIGRERIIPGDWGIDIHLSEEWMEKEAGKAYKVTGRELWKRRDFKIR